MAIVIVGEPFHKAGKTNRYVAARCECGKVFDTTWGARKRTKSCGCLRPPPSRLKHGNCMKHSGKEPGTYTTWRAMKERCANDKNKMWLKYGGRGINVCERWMKFESFLEDMGVRPSGHTIDRIDNDKGYEPGNCRWVLRARQNCNKSDNRMITLYGKTMCLADWCRIVQHEAKYDTIKRRLQLGWTDKHAIFGKG
jgi:hypothetical protein